jgi:hypothetical protein
MFDRLFPGAGAPLAAQVDAYVDRAFAVRGETPYAWAIRHLAQRDAPNVTDLYSAFLDDWSRLVERTTARAPHLDARKELRLLGEALHNAMARDPSLQASRVRLRALAGGRDGPSRLDVSWDRHLRDLAAGGLRLTAPGDAELLAQVELSLLDSDSTVAQHRAARRALALIGGEPGVCELEPTAEAEFEAFMGQAVLAFDQLNAWRDAVLSNGVPDPSLTSEMPPVDAILGLELPEAARAILRAPRYTETPREPAPGEWTFWPLAGLFSDPELRLMGAEAFAERVRDWRAWRETHGDLLLEAGRQAAPAAGESAAEAALRAHAASASGSAPSVRWLKNLGVLMGQAGAGEGWLRSRLRALPPASKLGAAAGQWRRAAEYAYMRAPYEKARVGPALQVTGSMLKADAGLFLGRGPSPHLSAPIGAPLELDEPSASLLKGAAWGLAACPDPSVVSELEAAARALLVKIPRPVSGAQPLSLGAAYGCVWALGRIGSAAAVAALGRLKRAVRDERLAARIAAAMAEAAAASGVSVDDVEELAAPDAGLDQIGRTQRRCAGHLLALEVEGGRARISVTNFAGKRLKAPPASLKADPDGAEALSELRAAAREIDGLLPLMRQRLEESYVSGRDWSWEDWRERWLDHPVAGVLARRLIWRLDDGRTVAWDGALVTADGGEASPASRVRLWHPTLSPPAEIARWRAWLGERAMVQPFAQAHRETYAPAPEEAERTYSNRFAGHILRQHQYMALAKSRGWGCRHRMDVDAPNDEPTSREVRAQDLIAEWWIHAPPGQAPGVTDAGAFVYVHSDRVMFHPSDGGGPIPLAAVEPLVFSEIMREVDLCVSAASIASDPAWVDQGGAAEPPNSWRAQARAYWREQAEADLDEAGRARAALLAELLPGLSGEGRLRVEVPHVRVEGVLATYFIHIGNANVRMEPGGRYLAIGPTGSDREIYLPFEGDYRLSLVLSKALLLAADDRIDDPSITAQIRREP